MSADTFYRLAPFIREYIYREKWPTLRPVQVDAINAILDEQNHVLICSATASGKTEAALFPILTLLELDPPASIGVLYIGPLKALINDQFLRLTGLLAEGDVPVQSWHGDVSQSKRQRFLKRARGILQITPESLEAMLMHRTFELKRLFGDLRFVVIDEVHAFVDSDRGRQVMCQLERLARYQAVPARRIGLSATLGEPEKALSWLRGASGIDASPVMASGGRTIELALEYFLFPDLDALPETPVKESSAPSIGAGDGDDGHALEGLIVDPDAFYSHLHSMTQRVRKTLIFANSRQATEDIGLNLRRISELEGLPSFYHVHHGNVAAPLRESAEEAMKEEDQPACVAATVTLELGIDVGQLDQVLQVNSTHAVSSFVQRLGRSGRRDGPARMFFYSTETVSDARHFGDEIPWDLLQTLATIQLYVEEKWIEPPLIPRLPFSLLYHQTMSILYSHTELSPPQLAERVLTLSPLKHVTAERFRQLLHHLLDIEHLERTERGRLIIGVGAEKTVNNYRFFAVFRAPEDYRVRDKSREIGTIPDAPAVDSTLVLAGFMWRVLSVDTERRIVEVTRAKRKGDMTWSSIPPDIHTRVLRMMREILLSDRDFIYLSDRARRRLGIARQAAHRADLATSSILPLADRRFLLLPWCGTRQFATLVLLLRNHGFGITHLRPPYYLALQTDCASAAEFRDRLANICAHAPSASTLAQLVPGYELQRLNKYNPYIPEALLRLAYSVDYLDIDGAVKSIDMC